MNKLILLILLFFIFTELGRIRIELEHQTILITKQVLGSSCGNNKWGHINYDTTEVVCDEK